MNVDLFICNSGLTWLKVNIYFSLLYILVLCIVKIKDSCDKWFMCLNSSKCKVMHFGSAIPEMEYFIGIGSERVKVDKTEA